MRGISYN